MKRLRVALSALAAATALSACGDDDGGIRESAPSGMLADSAVLAAMRDTVTVDRLIYDPAPDLSLSSAQQRRPDIFRAPAGAPATRDTTTAEDGKKRS